MTFTRRILETHSAIKTVNNNLTEILSNQMLLKKDTIKTRFEVAGTNNNDLQKMISLLEKLDLAVDKNASAMQGRVGLGTSNIMSMACELLLHREAEAAKKSSFLLIEEPEAHVHAQRQLKLIQSLENEAESKNQQIIMTTHSPLLASVVKLGNIILVKDGKVFPMAEGYTKLKKDDYKYLEKYLDATKANLFFARSVIIVEGPGEALLWLRRYAGIFQRVDSGTPLDIKVACVTDRDVMPDCAPHICINEKYTSDPTSWPEQEDRNWKAEADFTPEKAASHIKDIKQKADGQQVLTFIADHWTLEYDLAYVGLQHDEMKAALIKAVVKVCYVEKNWDSKLKSITADIAALSTLEEKSSYFYKFFTKKTASKADFAQQLAFELEETFAGKSDKLRKALPTYLVNAIEYVAGE